LGYLFNQTVGLHILGQYVGLLKKNILFFFFLNRGVISRNSMTVAYLNI